MSKALFGDLLEKADPIKTPVNGEIVSGIVVSANQKMIIVDIGNGQFTGVIAGTHMTSSTEDAGNLSAGDIVDSIVLGEDRHSGIVHLSLRKASQIKLIEKLHSNFDTKEIITVIPNEANKGGLLIDLDGIKGFIPVSQLTPVNYPRVEGANPERILEHLQRLVGKPFKVRVINVDNDGKKIIFSEKAALDEQRAAVMSTLKSGDIVDGVVSGILTYGLFITFNGIEGLVHVSEIDWGHVANPSKFAKIGDQVKVQVIGVEGDKISLSMKRLRANPWAELAAKYKVDDIVEVPILRVSQFGVFLALDGGISGLIHLSEVTGDVSELKANDICKAKIITFDAQAKRIGLSMKALDPNYTGPSPEAIAAAESKPKRPARKPKAEGEVTVTETAEVTAE
jgi:small subunit ribosomal protein S1